MADSYKPNVSQSPSGCLSVELEELRKTERYWEDVRLVLEIERMLTGR